ncbi:amidase [Pleionea mediterranea]|uniref:Amidase n=1 Tax=Pleionea mediterranea TaxID=523701 RepID=A0A316FAQ0_9GAMM|nr:amidase [Pleionea mediterranea]PWK43617.1 amidase [Pleionea mediterranea]
MPTPSTQNHFFARSVSVFISAILISFLSACATVTHDKPALHTSLEQWTSTETIEQLHQRLLNNEFSVTDLTEFYIHQIETKNPQLSSVILINPDALTIAKQLDQELTQGKIRSKLHGMPILLKDNIETQDMPTTAGSFALKDNHTRRDATITKDLRTAGAVILGKANLSEWANIRSERSSSGWSAIGGQTRNPHDPSRTPCGSSSGSGASVAANMAIAAIGTETNGSITCPAAVNGVVGVKPTVGLASRFGIVPISHTQDTAGPMTKFVADAALILQHMSSADELDSATSARVFDRSVNLVPTTKPLDQFKLGMFHSSATNHEQVKALEQQLIEWLEQQQVSLVKDLKTSPYSGFWNDTYQVLLFELKHDLNQYLGGLPNQYNALTLEKLIEFNENNKAIEMPYFQQEIFEKAQQKDDLDSQEYQTALKKIREETRNTLQSMINENKLDALTAITRGPAWKIDRVNGDNANGGVSTYSAVSGYPHITIPLGKVHGLPIGVSIMGLPHQEAKLFEVAQALESLIQQQSMLSKNDSE